MKLTKYPPGAGSTLVCGAEPTSSTVYHYDACPVTPAAATGGSSMAMGASSTASTDNAVAIGVSANADGDGSALAIGTSSNCGAELGTAIGSLATLGADAYAAIAIGYATNVSSAGTATGAYSICLGEQATMTQTLSVGTLESCIAMGNTAQIIGGNSGNTAIGFGAQVNTYETESVDSIAIGTNAISRSGIRCISIGHDSNTGGTGNTAGATSAIAIGDGAASASGMAIGAGATSSDGGIAVGTNSVSFQKGQFAHSSGNAVGDEGRHQYYRFVCRGTTTNATATSIQTTGNTVSTVEMQLEPRTTWRFHAMVVGRAEPTAGGGDSFTADYVGAIKRDNASATALIGSVTTLNVKEDAGVAGAWSAVFTANDTYEALELKVTGEASHTIEWTAVIEIASVSTDAT